MERVHPRELIINTDGGSRGNPGPAAIGVAFSDPAGAVLRRFGKAIGTKTNNEAEYEAVLFALQKARALWGRDAVRGMAIEVRMDSELVCRQLTGEYKIEEERLWPLYMRIHNALMDFPNIRFRHVPREQNREADRMVNDALDREQGELFAEG